MDDLSIREKDFTKRLEWNVNKEISEEILKAADLIPMQRLHRLIDHQMTASIYHE